MAQNLRGEVLKAFKSLHRARRLVFDGDEHALRAARERINDEYRKCKQIQDITVIQELLNHSKEVENELKATVIQAREVAPGKFEVKLRDEIVKLDNVPFKNCSP